MPRIRKATENDIPAIHQLVYELAVFENEPNAVATTPELYLKDFRAGHFDAIVAEVEGEVIGMMLFYTTYSSWKGLMLYLDDFVVTEKYRRQGVGQLLYDALLNIAEELGCALVKWQVLDWNTSAVDFYKKNKATIEKEWWNVKVYL